MLRLHEAEQAGGRMPSKIVLNPGDYARLLIDMRRYGFVSSRYRRVALQLLNVPIVCDDVEETIPEYRTVRFEWSE